MREKLVLVKPSGEYLEKIYLYRKEFRENNEHMYGTAGLERVENIEEWLELVEKNKYKETYSKDFVPSSQFLTIRKNDNKVVGMINIRHRLNDNLLRTGGHIGYSIRKSERKKRLWKSAVKISFIRS